MAIIVQLYNQDNIFKSSRPSVATALSRREKSATVDGRKIALKSAAGLFDDDKDNDNVDGRKTALKSAAGLFHADNADLGDHDDVAYKDDQPL